MVRDDGENPEGEPTAAANPPAVAAAESAAETTAVTDLVALLSGSMPGGYASEYQAYADYAAGLEGYNTLEEATNTQAEAANTQEGQILAANPQMPAPGAGVSTEGINNPPSDALSTWEANQGPAAFVRPQPTVSPEEIQRVINNFGRGAISIPPEISGAGITPDDIAEASSQISVEPIPKVRSGLADLNGDLAPAASLKGLSSAESTQIRDLLSLAAPAAAEGTAPADVSEFQAALTNRIASLWSDDRSQVLSNIPSPGSPAADKFSEFLGNIPDDDPEKAPLATFALSFPAGDVGNRAMDLISAIRDPQSEEQQNVDINSLTQLAIENNVPVTLARSVDAPLASSPAGVLQIMPLDGTREFASQSSYDDAGTAFAQVVNAAAAPESAAALESTAAPEGTATPESTAAPESTTASDRPKLRAVIQTGSRGTNSFGTVKPSIYGGAEGTGQIVRFLTAALDQRGIDLEPTVVTDDLNDPVVQGVNKALGNTNVVVRTDLTTQQYDKFLQSLDPHAVLSIGHDDYSGTDSLIGAANTNNIPTFSISASPTDAVHQMIAPTAGIDNGAEAFITGLTKTLDPS